MSVYVTKTWHASDQADANGNYIHISGRAGGLISLLFNLLGISPTVELKVSADQISFIQGSWGGLIQYNLPLENVCATLYGYIKPWKEAIILGVVIGVAIASKLGIILGIVIGIVSGIIYYFLNKKLKVGFSDMGGRASQIVFKRSISEGHNINEQAAADVCRIIQTMVQRMTAYQLARQSSTPASAVSNPPPPSVVENNVKYYYVDDQSKLKGPFSYAEILTLEKTGVVKPDTSVGAEGAKEWSTCSAIKSKTGTIRL